MISSLCRPNGEGRDPGSLPTLRPRSRAVDTNGSPSTEAPISRLSQAERTELTRCEEVINQGWENFVQVGRALTIVRDRRLYRDTHRSFEAYCRERWQYGKSYAYYLIGASEVVRHLSTIVDTALPRCEAQIRPLIGLTPDQMREVWTRAVIEGDSGPVTAKSVREKAAACRPPRPTTPKLANHASFAGNGASDESVRALQVLERLEQAIRHGSSSDTILTFLAALRQHLRQLAAMLRPE